VCKHNSKGGPCSQCLVPTVARVEARPADQLALRPDEQRHREVCRNGGHARAKRYHSIDHQRASAAVRWTRITGIAPEQRAAEIRTLHAEGLARWQIAERLGVAKSTIARVLGKPSPEEISAARRHAANCQWAARRASKESQCR
jgi:hypothetical protein